MSTTENKTPLHTFVVIPATVGVGINQNPLRVLLPCISLNPSDVYTERVLARTKTPLELSEFVSRYTEWKKEQTQNTDVSQTITRIPTHVEIVNFFATHLHSLLTKGTHVWEINAGLICGGLLPSYCRAYNQLSRCVSVCVSKELEGGEKPVLRPDGSLFAPELIAAAYKEIETIYNKPEAKDEHALRLAMMPGVCAPIESYFQVKRIIIPVDKENVPLDLIGAVHFANQPKPVAQTTIDNLDLLFTWFVRDPVTGDLPPISPNNLFTGAIQTISTHTPTVVSICDSFDMLRECVDAFTNVIMLASSSANKIATHAPPIVKRPTATFEDKLAGDLQKIGLACAYSRSQPTGDEVKLLVDPATASVFKGTYTMVVHTIPSSFIFSSNEIEEAEVRSYSGEANWYAMVAIPTNRMNYL